MFVSIINDCRDQNAMARQMTRAAGLFNAAVIPVGVQNELEAAGNLIDILDTADDGKGVVLLNVAPRHGRAKKWHNGTPFTYFRVNNVLIVASIDGESLSLVKKFELVQEVSLMDIPTVLDCLVRQNEISQDLQESITHTQFRSLEFVPRVASWIQDGKDIPSKPYSLSEVQDAPNAVWFIDNFGNCKTTLLPQDVDFDPGKTIETKIGPLSCYERLKDLPNDKAGLIIGSSGYKEKRFLEVMMQGKSAKDHFNLEVGSRIL